jgi:hypothetical protein
MDHVNIISKEAITHGISWPIVVVGSLVCIAMIGCLVYLFVTRDADKSIRLIIIVGGSGFALLVVTLMISSFFRTPTGRYRYEATIDEENMTVAEYNEFMKAYNHSYCKDGIYHFEDWVE